MQMRPLGRSGLQIAPLALGGNVFGWTADEPTSFADVAGKPRACKVKDCMNPRGQRILTALDAVAARSRSTPARVALAWLRAQPTVTAPIASATRLDQLYDLVEAVRLSLDPAALADLAAASA